VSRALIQDCLLEEGGIASRRPERSGAAFARTAAAADGHITQIREAYQAIWNDWFPKSGKTPAEAPSFERHNDSFDPRTGHGGVTIWIPIRA
jgi:AraC family transcriptional regulator